MWFLSCVYTVSKYRLFALTVPSTKQAMMSLLIFFKYILYLTSYNTLFSGSFVFLKAPIPQPDNPSPPPVSTVKAHMSVTSLPALTPSM